MPKSVKKQRLDQRIAKASEAEGMFPGLLEAAPDAMVVVDQTGRIVLVNSQTERLFGYQREELLGHDVEVLLPKHLRERHRFHRMSFPLVQEIESLNERIQEYDRRIAKMAKEEYPETALLKQVKGVGDLIATAYVLTVEDPHRFRKSRDAGCFVGLQPGRRNSGESEPQMHISKEGDEYLRTLLVQGAHYILGPFGEDSDLRRWGKKLSARGEKNAKKRAVVAVARKLAVLLHRLWVSGEVYEPLRNSQKAMGAAA
jgi:PAS domain S-box-containing protein